MWINAISLDGHMKHPIRSSLLLVEDIVGRLFPEQVQPDVKCSPVLDRRGGDLDFYRRVPPDTVALCPGEGFIPALSDKGEALTPGRADRLCDRQ